MCIPWLSPSAALPTKSTDKKWEYGKRPRRSRRGDCNDSATPTDTRPEDAFYLEPSACTYTPRSARPAEAGGLGVLFSARRWVVL